MLLSLAALSCLSLCDPMDCSPSGSSLLGDSPRQEYWSGLSCPPPMDLPNPGTEHRSPVLEADSLPSKPPDKNVYITLQRNLDKLKVFSVLQVYDIVIILCIFSFTSFWYFEN